jgi:hypothetical protein
MSHGIECLGEVDSYNNNIRVSDQEAGDVIQDCNNGSRGGSS